MVLGETNTSDEDEFLQLEQGLKPPATLNINPQVAKYRGVQESSGNRPEQTTWQGTSEGHGTGLLTIKQRDQLPV